MHCLLWHGWLWITEWKWQIWLKITFPTHGSVFLFSSISFFNLFLIHNYEWQTVCKSSMPMTQVANVWNRYWTLALAKKTKIIKQSFFKWIKKAYTLVWRCHTIQYVILNYQFIYTSFHSFSMMSQLFMYLLVLYMQSLLKKTWWSYMCFLLIRRVLLAELMGGL